MTTRALPETYRQANRIYEGYEVHCPVGWLKVVKTMRMHAPANIVRLDFADGTAWVGNPITRLFSRRSAS